MIKGARPIKCRRIHDHHQDFQLSHVTLHHYTDTWERWILDSNTKKLHGIEKFCYRDFVCGTSQSFDHFWLRHSNRRAVCLAGDFQYHQCLGKHMYMETITNYHDLRRGDALAISMPFSDYGRRHPDMEDLLSRCESLSVPVCLDLAYWGISKDICLDLGQFDCIEEFSCSLSKPFFVLENHRIGVRFTRAYMDDGITMLNEVGMQNYYSMALGVHFMDQFSSDWNWQEFGQKYQEICQTHELTPCDTVIFGLGDGRYSEFNRGIPNNNRVCVSDLLADM